MERQQPISEILHWPPGTLDSPEDFRQELRRAAAVTLIAYPFCYHCAERSTQINVVAIQDAATMGIYVSLVAVCAEHFGSKDSAAMRREEIFAQKQSNLVQAGLGITPVDARHFQ